MQVSLKFATALLVAFSFALASSAWEPPFGSLALFLIALALTWLFVNPPWLTYVARGVLFGTFAFVVACMIATIIAKHWSEEAHRLVSSVVGYVAMRYTFPLAGIPGGVIGYFAHVRLTNRLPRGSSPLVDRSRSCDIP